MTNGNQTASPGRHPWFATLEQDRKKALEALLSSHPSIHPYDRLDPPDAAMSLFASVDRHDGAWKTFSAAIIDWLESRRREQLPASLQVRQRQIREVSEAFEIVYLLEITDAAVELRHRFVVWNDWVDRLVLSKARDARAEYWRMLALTQPSVATGPSTSDRSGLTPLWQRICRESGASLPKHYLAIGLLGLRRLPQGRSGSEAAWLSGLAQWALARRPSEKEFMAEWLALKSLYPRAPERWRRLVADLLSAPMFKAADLEAPAWWAADPAFAAMTRRAVSVARPLRSPFPADAHRVVAELDAGLRAAEPHVDALMRAHREYVQATGDPQYFVRAIHLVGSSLLAADREIQACARKAQAMAREGLAWDVDDAYLWTLWANALVAEGKLEAGEFVYWESVRRLPSNVQQRNQLATLIMSSEHRRSEAEALLRETITLFPKDVTTRNQLATLIASFEYRRAEAEALLQETVTLFPQHVITRNQLATLIAGFEHRRAEAEASLRETMRLFPQDVVARNQLAPLIASFAHRRPEAEALLRETIQLFPRDAVSRMLLASLLMKDGRRAEASEISRTVENAPLLRSPKLASLLEKGVPDELLPKTVEPSTTRSVEQSPGQTLSTLLRRGAEPSKDGAVPKEGTRAPREESKSVRPAPDVATAVFQYGSLRRLSFRLERNDPSDRSKALEEVQRILREEPTFAYAELLAARNGVWTTSQNSLPTFAAAFEKALATEDRALLDNLAQTYPRLGVLTLIARMLFGDADAAERVHAWIGSKPAGEENAIRALRETMRPLLGQIGEGSKALQREHKEIILKMLRAANENAAGDFLLVA